MCKRAKRQDEGESSEDEQSTTNFDVRRKTRSTANVPGLVAPIYQTRAATLRAALQPRYPTRSTRTIIPQSLTSASSAARQPSSSSAAVVPHARNNHPFDVPVGTDYTGCWPTLAYKTDIIIVGPDLPFNMPCNAKYIPDFKARLPNLESKEALKGQRHGTLKMGFEAPGIPFMKYKKEQASEVARQNKWSVQAIFKIKDTGKWYVLYEGWGSKSIVKYNNDEVHSPHIRQYKLREKFLKKYAELNNTVSIQQVENQLSCDSFLEEEEHLFWSYQDLTFFHSNQERQHATSKASIHYFCVDEKMVPPPKYMYTAYPIVEANVIEYCRKLPSNNTFQQLLNLNKKVASTVQRICENAEDCKCDSRYAMLYAGGEPVVKNVQFLEDGRIDTDSFSIDERRVIIECSDECGCSMNCPRRPLQKGQQKSVAVFHEGGHKGFGLRAMEKIHKGEFIMEYVGLVFNPDTKTRGFMDTKSATYEASCDVIDDVKLVIDSQYVGNTSRFINHKCAPNAAFIDTESRRNENDLLIPRISVYALEDIEIGESIFLRYWATVDLEDEGIDCDCGTDVCLEVLPIRKA